MLPHVSHRKRQRDRHGVDTRLDPDGVKKHILPLVTANQAADDSAQAGSDGGADATEGEHLTCRILALSRPEPHVEQAGLAGLERESDRQRGGPERPGSNEGTGAGMTPGASVQLDVGDPTDREGQKPVGLEEERVGSQMPDTTFDPSRQEYRRRHPHAASRAKRLSHGGPGGCEDGHCEQNDCQSWTPHGEPPVQVKGHRETAGLQSSEGQTPPSPTGRGPAFRWRPVPEGQNAENRCTNPPAVVRCPARLGPRRRYPMAESRSTWGTSFCSMTWCRVCTKMSSTFSTSSCWRSIDR